MVKCQAVVVVVVAATLVERAVPSGATTRVRKGGNAGGKDRAVRTAIAGLTVGIVVARRKSQRRPRTAGAAPGQGQTVRIRVSRRSMRESRGPARRNSGPDLGPDLRLKCTGFPFVFVFSFLVSDVFNF